MAKFISRTSNPGGRTSNPVLPINRNGWDFPRYKMLLNFVVFCVKNPWIFGWNWVPKIEKRNSTKSPIFLLKFDQKLGDFESKKGYLGFARVRRTLSMNFEPFRTQACQPKLNYEPTRTLQKSRTPNPRTGFDPTLNNTGNHRYFWEKLI